MKLQLFVLLFLLNIGVYGQSNDIIITEIMADPSPSKGLPEREYLELYNTTNEDISLKNFSLLYGNFKATFADFLLKSNEYVIVCRKGYESEFSEFGRVVTLTSFSLSNEGSLLVLKDANNQDVNFVEYAIDWHSEVNSGGVSFEMKDVNYPCVGKHNWASSINKLGGSPGMVNSIAIANPDVLSPFLLNSSLNLNEISLNFNENLSLDFLNDKSNFIIKNQSNQIERILISTYKPSEVIIYLKDPLEIGTTLTLGLSNLKDCSGNLAEDFELEFMNLSPPVKGEILLSEILFNPKLGGEDFVELYNSSDNILNLKNWKLARLDGSGQIEGITTLISYDLLLEPKKFVAFTRNKSFLIANYPRIGNVVEVSNLPAYNNDEGSVIVLNDNENEFDRYSYSEKAHHELVVNPEGISLERTNFGSDKNNWQSASSDYGFATPGLENSQATTDVLQNVFYADPIVFNPFQTNDHSTTKLKYQLNATGCSASIDIINKNGFSIKTLVNNLTLGTEGEITWDGKDNQGQLLPLGYYVFRIKLYSEKINKVFLAKCVLGSN